MIGAPGRRAARRLLARLAAALTGGPDEQALRILTYHRVNDQHPWDRMSVRPAEFARQMAHIAASGRPVVPLLEAATRLRGEGASLAPGTLCLTFDDGYRDNLECAAPVLDRVGFPATVFVVTGRMGQATPIDRYEACCDHDRSLDWSDALELARRGFALGGHGRTHRELATLGAEELRDEIVDCREALVRHTGQHPRTFCYPRGSESPAVRSVLQDAGFEAAATVYPGVNRPDSEPLLLRRTEISGQDEPVDFRLKLAGIFDAWHALWQRLRPRGA